MQKTPELIRKKWELKFKQLQKRTETTHSQHMIDLKLKLEKDQVLEFQRKVTSYTKKKNAYLKKKEQEYKRKCENEIRALEGKPPKEKKHKKLSRNQKLQFALQIAQENAKLRDTDPEGNGYCISCDELKSRSELAGGHDHSRQFQSICLRPENINAQCHRCNMITGPGGNVNLRAQVQARYRQNLIAKYGEDRILEMEEHLNKGIANPAKYAPTEPFLDEYIPDLIKQNESFRKTKTFTPPQRKNRRKLYKKYFNQELK